MLVGRTEYDSPEVDNEVYVPAPDEDLVGRFAEVLVESASEYDLHGVLADGVDGADREASSARSPGRKARPVLQ